MRSVVPYEVEQSDADSGVVVGATPTFASRQTHGNGYWDGIYVWGELGEVLIPIQKPWAGQGLESKVFPNWQPSKVAPDAIKPALLITRNDFSPVSHASARYEFSKKLPVPATVPLTKFPGVNHFNRRSSGAAYTIPYPMTYPNWPTSSQWLADRMGENQI